MQSNDKEKLPPLQLTFGIKTTTLHVLYTNVLFFEAAKWLFLCNLYP